MMTSRSSFSIAFFMSARRVCEFAACPQKTMARRLSGWSMLSLDSSTRSNQRRSEEHTSELQSLMRISYAVFCLKKKRLQNGAIATVTTELHEVTIEAHTYSYYV